MAFRVGEDEDVFKASELARWFHSTPHKDFHFKETTKIFTPSDKSYNEALFLIAIVISSFGAFLFVVFVLYYTCCFWRLCKKVNPRLSKEVYHTRRSCLLTFIIILGVIICGAAITGFIFNGRTSDGIDQFSSSVDNIKKNINAASSLGKGLRQRLNAAIQGLDLLRRLVPEAVTAYEDCVKMRPILDNLIDLLPQHVVDVGGDFGDDVQKYDDDRWVVTVLVITSCMLLCIFSFWIGCQHGCCVMSMVTILSMSSLLFTWILMGADFGVAVGVSDFCVNPGKSIQSFDDSNITTVVVNYYMNCRTYNPFDRYLSLFDGLLYEVISIVQSISGHEELTDQILNDLDEVKNNLSVYEADIMCQKTHQEYMNAMDGLCGKALNGIAIIILSLLITGFLSGLMTCAICPLWKYRRNYDLVFRDISRHVNSGYEQPKDLWPSGCDHVVTPEPRYRPGPGDYARAAEQTPLIATPSPTDYETMNGSNSQYINVNRQLPSLPAKNDGEPSVESDHYYSSPRGSF